MSPSDTRRVLVIGAGGYVGRELVASADASVGLDAVALVRPGARTVLGAQPLESAATLDRIFADEILGRIAPFDQIISLPQLTRPDVDWLLDRVDGPRWLVFSSAQLDARHGAPGADEARARERLAVERGGVVIRPTMVFGRGGDANISKVVRTLARTRLSLEIGDGSNLVQPIHVDDLVALTHAHLTATITAGVYPVGGAEALPSRELTIMLHELLGVRVPPVRVPASVVGRFARLGRVAGLRPDQVARLLEDKTVDDMATRRAFGWQPAPFAHRVEQAVYEALAPQVTHVARPVGGRGAEVSASQL